MLAAAAGSRPDLGTLPSARSASLSPEKLSRTLLDLAPDRLIAISRLILAGVATAAVWLDPKQPDLNPELTYAILIGYLTYAAVYAAAVSVVLPFFRLHLAAHVIDIAVFAALMLLVDGPTSPFFVLFAFALFAATLRWNWQGALATTVALVVLFVALLLVVPHEPSEPQDVTRVVIRGGFLLVAGAILTYLGALRERASERLAKLADWPADAVCDQEIPPLEKTLAHAAAVLGAARALVVWELGEEPYHCLAWHDETGFHFNRRAPVVSPVIAEALADTPLLLFDAADGTFRTRHSARIGRDQPLDPALVDEFSIRRAVVAPVRGERLSGHVILMDIGWASEDLLALAEIVASHVAGQIEHHMLHRELAEAAAARERMRLARNVHDSTLQTLTAIGLQVAALKSGARKKAEPAIDELQQVVAAQQRRLRDFVSAFRDPTEQPVELKPLIGRVLRDAAAQWRCRGSVKVDPPDLLVRSSLASELSLMVMEAVANASRHGQASRIDISVAVTADGLSIVIADDGAGARKRSATSNEAQALTESSGSRSLRDRVRDLGGTITFAKNWSGTMIRIELPS